MSSPSGSASYPADFDSAMPGPSSSRTNAVAGPSSPSRAKTFYPQWPETHEEAEYYEIPPDHFLAQQRGPQKAVAAPAPAPAADAHQRRSSVASTDSRSSDPSSATHIQPLAELATAIQSGLPVVPAPTATLAAASQRSFQDVIPTPATFAEAHEEMPDTSTLAAADFDIDVRSGFLPPEAPVIRLRGKHEQLWEVALDQAKSIPLMQGGGGVRITSQQRLEARRWRRSIREMPVLSLSEEVATDIRYARRGHLVLSFLAHFYIHSQPPPAPQAAKAAASSWRGYFSRKSQQQIDDEQDVADELEGKFSRTLPAAIAVPWVQLSQKLALPPILTYATTVLWNWAYIDPAKGLALDNIRMLETFTNTKSEEHFYLTSALIEIRGVEALELMRVSLDEAFVGDRLSRRRIAAYLNRLAVVIADLTQLLHDVRTDCDPKVFYWGIRPWFRGSDAAEGGEEPGWHFEGVDSPGVRRSFSGPSAGQSSLIHAIDVFLDVDHTRSKPRQSRPAVSPASAANESEAIRGDSRGADATFMERMQLYMPGHHRNFLTHLRSISFDDEDDDKADEARLANLAASQQSQSEDDVADDIEAHAVERPPPVMSHPIRSLALKAQEDGHEEGLPSAYDNALNALKALRDGHMRVAYLYIIAQARGSPPDEFAPLPKGFTGVMGVEDAVSRSAAKAKQAAQGDDVLDAADSSQKGAKGTGGTDLVTFLKDCRVNTTDALIAAGKTTSRSIQSATVATASAIGAPVTSTGAQNGGSGGATSGDGGSSSRASDGQSLDASSAPGLGPPSKASGNTEADPATTSSPACGGLQVWAIDVSGWEPDADRFSSLVDQLLPGSIAAGDREKIRKYYRQVDRTRSLAARLLPRLMFARHYGVRWDEMRFAATREGRPYLEAPSLAGATDFNISHDSDWVVLAFHAPTRTPSERSAAKDATPPAVASDRATSLLGSAPVSQSMLRVGVDVMQIALPKFEQDARSFAETMDMALSPDERRWVLAPLSPGPRSREVGEAEALSRLFDLWTHKEAFTKNIGKGLGFDFKTVELALGSLGEDRHRRSTSPGDVILRIKGVAEPSYSFVEVQLPGQAAGGAPSQVVVAEGPFDESERGGRRQVGPPIEHDEAVRSGLLKVWTMAQIVQMAEDAVAGL
ncbi:uncharacterized protein PFL1_06466 [Pseudozyma flocculosa PF-1]|uniref:Related to BNA2 - tryptophan 2,3-dioxygenase n=2 Tax=Pseudozyma flocculosa TaxID=84751 RepID=A0A5C3EX65_9BASI|nr:uncharacterized protein PFL1_06466 [Pseudozyma flocculosa PF-1]EPQ26012.1 hypothetical protein PFL1_06466 [Pseudozyma flocculosa PF-1]SPO35681.1 related to BNA2 - tryptophan 2,3-dioxygenase [Pseudozyma flocculosa]